MAHKMGILEFDVLTEFDLKLERLHLNDITPDGYAGSLYRHKNFRADPSTIIFRKYVPKAEALQFKKDVFSQIGHIHDLVIENSAYGGCTFYAKVLEATCGVRFIQGHSDETKDTEIQVSYSAELIQKDA